MSATPQRYTVDDIAALIAADFAAHNINAAVEVGEWEPEAQPGEPRVIVDLGDGTIGEPGGHYQPGAWWPIPNSTDRARPILDDAQRFTLAIHAPGAAPSAGGETAGAAARRATDQLLRQTMRAVRRSHAAPFREPARLKWPTATKTAAGDYQGWVKGSLAVVDVVLVSPILDDAVGVATMGEIESSVAAELADGTQTPDETFTTSEP